jgi:hypothetical protein
MIKETTKPILADACFGFLKHLKREQKIQVVYELVRDIADCQKFCGAWKSEKNAEEIISEIRNARLSSREIEVF